MRELYHEGFTQNRELSWLRFNERVLEEAADPSVPLFERLKFIAIFSSNLDEFFMVRVGSLLDLRDAGEEEEDPRSGWSASRQLAEIDERMPALMAKRDRLYEEVSRELAEVGVVCVSADRLREGERRYVEQYYRNKMAPHLSPLVLTDRKPFPALRNKTTYLAGTLRTERGQAFALLPLPDREAPFLLLPPEDGETDGLRFILIEEIAAAYFSALCAPFVPEEQVLISITRNADTKAAEENSDLGEDLREKMQALVDLRRHLAPLRLEIKGEISRALRAFLLERLDLTERQCITTSAPPVMRFVYALEETLSGTQKASLCYPPFVPSSVLRAGTKVFALAERQDILSCYPYDSMAPLLALLREAADDRAVTEIRMTIYRLAEHPMIITHLIRAAENGKKVRVLLELRARFDEQKNIDWSERLERAGCRVYYGSEEYKVHSKLCQVVRRTKEGVRFITQIGTGNYNEKTACLYTDLSLITCDREIGEDAARFFEDLVRDEREGHYHTLLAAPSELKEKLIALIEAETAKKERGRIFLKINSLTDADLIEKLSEASAAGVRVRMIVRGICCLLPGVEYCTETIEVVNVVGRFLEHSRVYVFGSGEDETMYISSADLMTRNTMRRYELACPIREERLRKRIRHLLYLGFHDTVKGRRMDRCGVYRKKGGRRLDSQAQLLSEIERNPWDSRVIFVDNHEN